MWCETAEEARNAEGRASCKRTNLRPQRLEVIVLSTLLLSQGRHIQRRGLTRRLLSLWKRMQLSQKVLNDALKAA
jgi:hypothetical protein